eukprot:803169-Lingulodinium_polyedra.AAC.1
MQAAVMRLCVAGADLDTPARREVVQVCEVIKGFLYKKFRESVHHAKGAPALVCYSSDGTPFHTKERVVHAVPGHSTIIREAGSSKEYLVQQAFLQFFGPTGDLETA